MVQFPKLRVIPRSSFAAAPWKNGGGITHEALRVPSGGEAFRWRVSVAQIDASGPFSDFPAYRRTMVLLRGSGVELHFADGGRRALRRVGEAVEFDGASPIECKLLDGPCVDLNLMVSKAERASVRVEQFTEPLTATALAHESTLIFAIDGAIGLESGSGETATLEPWDLAVLSHGDVRLSRVDSQDRSGTASVFLAALRE